VEQRQQQTQPEGLSQDVHTVVEARQMVSDCSAVEGSHIMVHHMPEEIRADCIQYIAAYLASLGGVELGEV